MGAGPDEVWTAVLTSLRARGLDFEDVFLGDVDDVEAILSEVFPSAPLYRALAASTWYRLARMLTGKSVRSRDGSASVRGLPPHNLHQPQALTMRFGSQSPLSEGSASGSAWSLFIAALATRDLTLEDVLYASVADRWSLLTEVFPHHPLWRAQANSLWAAQVERDACRAPDGSVAPSPSPAPMQAHASHPLQFAAPYQGFPSAPQGLQNFASAPLPNLTSAPLQNFHSAPLQYFPGAALQQFPTAPLQSFPGVYPQSAVYPQPAFANLS